MNVNLLSACSGTVATAEDLVAVRHNEIFRTLAEGAVLPQTPKAPEGKYARKAEWKNQTYGKTSEGLTVTMVLQYLGHIGANKEEAVKVLGLLWEDKKVSPQTIQTAMYHGRRPVLPNGNPNKDHKLSKLSSDQKEVIDTAVMMVRS